MENNINLSNMGWEDYTNSVDTDGVYRGEAVAAESDFEFSLRSMMTQRLAHLTPGAAERIRKAESPDEIAGMAIISRREGQSPRGDCGDVHKPRRTRGDRTGPVRLTHWFGARKSPPGRGRLNPS
ncbi:hypothetical protein F6W96_12090 [Nocardia terpenica]|uniref:DUF6924 domain-containing protein n=1 Tax=Nocardia terpenica TaxID=455432 RepID=A0A6G9Z126_9NOCA|nr:hypothetical protein [Nocardia terpenica]QIS18926.1 hypothetical protein F6W96_12090 [Nocardia terpenica]